MARPRLHILNTDNPIIHEGGNITVNCGVTLRNIKRAFSWDETEVGEMISTWPTGACKQCCKSSDRTEGR
jgi:hypothetical protein